MIKGIRSPMDKAVFALILHTLQEADLQEYPIVEKENVNGNELLVSETENESLIEI